MTIHDDATHENPSLVAPLLTELWKLLPQIAFSGTKGSYCKGQAVGVLVDKQPGEQPDTFDAGLTVFSLTREPVALANIGIMVAGSIEGHSNIKPMRRGVTNQRGCLTLKNLPYGWYRLVPAKSVVTSETPLSFSQPTNSDSSRASKMRKGDFSSQEFRRAVGEFASEPRPSLYQKCQAEDGSLSCTLYESEGELFLYFEVAPLEAGDVWVEYAIVEQDSEQVVTIDQQGQQIALTGQIQLKPGENGRYIKELSLGSDVYVPQLCSLRAYPVPSPSREDETGGQR